jgi:hypothetical protein
MQALRRWVGLGALALFMAAPAVAQENIDAGKSPAQLYAQNCAICHKTPHGLTKAVGPYGLQNFLREHYSASRESAAAIARYLASIDHGPAPRGRAVKRGPKKETAKTREEKTKNAGEPKPAKPEEAKPAQPSEAKTDAKPEGKAEGQADSKPSAPDAKTEGAKASSDAKPEKKSD